MSGKKIFKSVIIVAAAIFIMSNIVTYALDKSNVFDFFFDRSEPPWDVTKMTEENQKAEIGDYTVTLTNSLFNSETQICYCVFKISSNKGFVENTMVSRYGQKLNGSTFGENGRYGFYTSYGDGGSEGICAVAEGDDIYVFFKIIGTGCKEESPQVYIYNGGENIIDDVSDDRGMEAEFKIKENSDSVMISPGENSAVYISPLGVRFENIDYETIKDLSLLCDDGTDIELIKDFEENREHMRISTESEGENSENKEVIYEFTNIYDITGIKDISYNGKKYSDKIIER